VGPVVVPVSMVRVAPPVLVKPPVDMGTPLAVPVSIDMGAEPRVVTAPDGVPPMDRLQGWDVPPVGALQGWDVAIGIEAEGRRVETPLANGIPLVGMLTGWEGTMRDTGAEPDGMDVGADMGTNGVDPALHKQNHTHLHSYATQTPNTNTNLRSPSHVGDADAIVAEV
jgi:hypothetical protein